MKNFTNNFKQFTSRLSARWLIMALMLLVGTSSAWAKFEINSASICVNGTWHDVTGSDIALGEVDKAPVINSAWIKIDRSGGNGCSGTLSYKLGSNGSENSQGLNWNSENNSIQLWMTENFNKDINSISGANSVGSHTIYYWYKATGSSNSNSNCGETKYLSNNSKNYKNLIF